MGLDDETDDVAGEGVDSRDQLVLDEARRAVDQQKRDLEGLRSRAAALAALAVAVVGVLGGAIFGRDGPFSVLVAFAVECLVVVVLASLYVLKPRTFTLSLDIAAMDGRIDEGATATEMARDTSMALARDCRTNQAALTRMHWAYFVGLVALVGQTALLLVELFRR